MAQNVYADAGVDIEAGDALSQLAAHICEKSWSNNSHVTVRRLGAGTHFRGPRVWETHGLPSWCLLTGGMDGNGTKPIITVASGWFEAAGYDLVAMLAGDITRFGGMPAVMWNQLDTATLDKGNPVVLEAFGRYFEGLNLAAAKAKAVLLGGETAELGVCVGSDNPHALIKFLVSGCMVGYIDPERLITGENMRPGMPVMALQEYGPGGNWISAVRRGCANYFGVDWYEELEAQSLLREAAQGCEIYDGFLTELNGWFDHDFVPLVQVHGIAHITGGGIAGKFGNDLLFANGLSAELTDLWPVPNVLAKTVEWTECPQDQFYAGSGGGQRLLAVIDEGDVGRFTQHADRCYLNAKQCGVITRSEVPTLRVKSALTGEMIEYGC